VTRVSIIGAGYVGLVTGVCLAEKGHQVVCVESDAGKVERIMRGEPPIHEAGLGELLRRHVGRGFRASAAIRDAVVESDVTLIAVGTPFDGKAIDLDQVVRAADEIGDALAHKADYHVVAVKSTVVPGTTVGVVRERLELASKKRAGADFGLGANPEFLTEGQAIDDFMHPDRVVVGGVDARSLDRLCELYQDFGDVPMIRTNPSTAEMIKYASNSLLATMVSFANEIADLSSAVGNIDAKEVMRGVHASSYLTIRESGRRVAAPITSFLDAGCGFGGSCLPKDVSALAAHGQALGVDTRVLDAVMRVNRDRPERVLAHLRRHFPSLRGRRVTVLGLAFKPDTDDVRESPAFPIIRRLCEEGASVSAYDPVANPPARRVLGDAGIRFCDGLAAALDGAEAVVIITRWKEFEAVPELLRGADPAPLVFDGRRMLDPGAVARYDGIGL